MSVRVNLSRSIYPEACISEAIRAYSNYCSVTIGSNCFDSREIEISILANGSEHPDENTIVNEFLNYLLDVSLENHLQGFE